jgi:hypothetical protein
MDFSKKIFVSRDVTDHEVYLVKEILHSIDFESYLSESFLYIDMRKDGGLEIISVDNEQVFLASKELRVSNKMAIEYLRYQTKIEQSINSVLYWAGINNMKKFVPVKEDDGNNKEYADMNVYAHSMPEALRYLDELYRGDFVYIEDVDEEIW